MTDKRAMLATVLLFVALVITGCKPPVFQSPLSKPGSTELPKKLMGKWRIAGSKEADFKIEAAGDKFPAGMIRIKNVSSKSKSNSIDVETVYAFAVPIKNSLILHIPVRQFVLEDIESDDGNPFIQKWDEKTVAGYVLCKVRFQADNVLQLAYANWDYVDKLIYEKKLAGTRSWKDLEPLVEAGNAKENHFGALTVTLPPDELKKFIDTNLNRLFSMGHRVLVKVNSD